MAAGNSVTLVGNVTRDPELRETKSNASVVQFRLAVNRRWKSGDEWQEEVSFFDVTAWNDQAENIAASLQKGDRVLVFGRLNQQTWETQEGDKRSRVEIVADEVGPSLRWATAEVTKNPKKGDGGNSGGSSRPPLPDAPPGDAEEPF